MKARRVLSVIAYSVLLVVLMWAGGLSQADVSAQFTLPTRTPTPGGGGATATPGGGGGGATSTPGGGGGATATPGGGATATAGAATSTATQLPIPPSPEEGFLPTAESCSNNPTIRSLGSGVNVRSGPGLDYEIVEELLLNEVRPITGRAEYATWWQIETGGVETGWVSDSVVTVSGYTGDVPLVAPPPLPGGSTPTPGAPWSPTPNPVCTPEPTSTTTATPSATPMSSATMTTEPSATASPTHTASPSATATATVSPPATGTSEQPSVATAAPLPGEAEQGGNLNWLAIAGAGLLAAAGILFVVRRNGAGPTPTSE